MLKRLDAVRSKKLTTPIPYASTTNEQSGLHTSLRHCGYASRLTKMCFDYFLSLINILSYKNYQILFLFLNNVFSTKNWNIRHKITET